MHILFSNNIAALRKKNGLSQETLADFMNINRSTLASYEEYRSEPNIGRLQQFSQVLRVPIDDLVTKDLSTDQTSDLFFFQL